MQHNNFGELTKVTYPAGGYTRYAYAALPGWYLLNQNSTSGDVRVVTNSYSCANSSGSCIAAEERVTTYSATRQQSNSNNTAMTVTDPLGNYTTYTFTDAGTPSALVAAHVALAGVAMAGGSPALAVLDDESLRRYLVDAARRLLGRPRRRSELQELS